jgi:two-component system sensor histidine kinase/response regulator
VNLREPLQRGNIIVVDDQPANLKLLEDMLGGQGYWVRSLPRGRLALAAAAQKAPDLFLLDINMPEMDGYEVCKRLKADPRLARIPVIFLSALNETEDKVKAFQVGGVDYVTKPFQFEEVQARVDTHIQLRHLQQSLERHNEHLEETVAARTCELAEANQRLTILDQAKSDFLNLISHELRTPLNGLLGVGNLLLDEYCTSPADQELRGMFEQSQRRMMLILDDAALLTQIEVDGERFAADAVALTPILNVAAGKAAEFADTREVKFQAAPDCGLIYGDPKLLERALQALLETAAKFSKANGTVRLACCSSSDAVKLMIEGHGWPVPETEVPKFFDVFSAGKALTPGGDLGLAPAVAQRILSLFGGTATVENLDTPGMRLTVSLKCASGSAPANLSTCALETIPAYELPVTETTSS